MMLANQQTELGGVGHLLINVVGKLKERSFLTPVSMGNMDAKKAPLPPPNQRMDIQTESMIIMIL